MPRRNAERERLTANALRAEQERQERERQERELRSREPRKIDSKLADYLEARELADLANPGPRAPVRPHPQWPSPTTAHVAQAQGVDNGPEGEP